MHFRLELFVEDLQRSIRFYEEILTLVFSKKNTTGAMIKLGDFSLLLTPDYILNENHYLKTDGLNPKGKGVEIIIVFDHIEQIYQHVLEKNYPVESNLKMQSWGMKDFRIVDLDGYYLRLTSS
ncbi:VOC family protein [Bacillus cereus group sp. Bc256]|uniref:VOC family protein n=1 Tax=Bacillus cereus group sp. Bc256 TaxID=3018102 RepID=UPI0022E10CBF|nr:VOC family protein [Bacillus cereus group sp. Bc256]MDA2140345.1 VOC family protein [Bacillus cereus group sp. Bc256]